jgi:hypothetical protein
VRGRIRSTGIRHDSDGGRRALEEQHRVDVVVDLDEGRVKGDRVEGGYHVGGVGAGLDRDLVETVADAAGSGDRTEFAGGGVSGGVGDGTMRIGFSSWLCRGGASGPGAVFLHPPGPLADTCPREGAVTYDLYTECESWQAFLSDDNPGDGAIG